MPFSEMDAHRHYRLDCGRKVLFRTLSLFIAVTAVLLVSNPASSEEPTQPSGELLLSGIIDQDGVLSDTLELAFFYETSRITITVPQGTTALSAEGTPLVSIKVYPVRELHVSPVHNIVIEPAYDLCPGGATFSPPLSITIEYDPALCPSGIDDEGLFIAYFDVETNKWLALESLVDTDAHTITAPLNHFTMVAVLGELEQRMSMSWSLVWGIMAVVVILGLVIGLFVLRRRVVSTG